MKFVAISEKDKSAYEKLVNNRLEATCLQMWEWAKFRNQLGAKLFKRIGIQEGKDLHLVATYQISNYKVFGKVLYIPQGPIWDSPRVFDLFAQNIKSLAQKEGCHLVVLEPRVFSGDERYNQLLSNGFVYNQNTIQPRETVLVDLTKNEEELLASFSKNTRYNINYAARKGISIKRYDKPEDVTRINQFYDLLQETQQRNEFEIQPIDYFQKLWETFSENRHAHMFEAWFGNQVVSTIIMLHDNVWATSMFSSSSRKHSNLKHTYLLRWESIKSARNLGCKTYDFFGATSSQDTSHPFYHTTQFKLHFGHKVTSFAGTFEMIIDPVKYNLWKLAENLRIIKFYEKSIIKHYKNASQKG